MEPITLKFEIKKNISLPENTKRLVKLTSLSALEFFTNEKISKKIGHKYKLNNISILGTPHSVNIGLKEICDTFRTYISEFINGDDSFEEKMCQIDEAKIIIEEFRLSNQAYSYFLLDIPESFLLHTKGFKTINVNLIQVDIHSNNWIDIINEHLTVREKHFNILSNQISLLQKKFILNLQRYKIDNPVTDSKKVLELMEVWIALDQSNFFDYIPANERGVILPEIRKNYFEVFNLKDINYKKLRAQLLERKNSAPDFLKKLVEQYSKAIPKKAK